MATLGAAYQEIDASPTWTYTTTPFIPTQPSQPVGFVTVPPNSTYVSPPLSGAYTIYNGSENPVTVTDMASTGFTTTFSPTASIYDKFISSPGYFNRAQNEEPAIARNAELIKSIKELQTKMKCMKEGADDFFQKPQAVIIYFEMMMESMFKGKI